MVFNTTFNNISVISWWRVLLVEETEKNTDLSQVTDKLLSHNVVSSAPHHEQDSNCHMIRTKQPLTETQLTVEIYCYSHE